MPRPTGTIILGTCLTLILSFSAGCDDKNEDTADSSSAGPSIPGRKVIRPSAEQIEEDARRRRRIAEIVENGPLPAHTAELIGYLSVLIQEHRLLADPDGYAHIEARKVLRQIGAPAWPALLEAMADPDLRSGAFRTLADQGVLEAFDTAFEMPDAGGLIWGIVHYMPFRGLLDLEHVEAWYRQNRDKVVFDEERRLFHLDGDYGDTPNPEDVVREWREDQDN